MAEGYTVLIRDNQTGDERLYRMDTPWGGDFIWTEGNYACDCNRGLFFASAEDENDPDVPCGDKLYSVPWIELDDGQRIMIDG